MKSLQKKLIKLLVIPLANFLYISKYPGFFHGVLVFLTKIFFHPWNIIFYIRWWDRFNSPISFEFLPHNISSHDAIFTESASLSTRIIPTSLKLETMSPAFPSMLSPILYLQFLQVKAREPTLSNAVALIKAQASEFPNLYQYVKENVLALLSR